MLTEKAPTGYYRQILADTYPMIRIALTHTPMYGVTKVNPENALKVFDNSDDKYAKYYADGIRNGSMVTIVEDTQVERYFKAGELYFIS